MEFWVQCILQRINEVVVDSTDAYGHSLMFLFPRNGASAEIIQNSFCDRAFVHTQLRPCLSILVSNAKCPGVGIVVDFRDVPSVEHINALLSSLVICQNEMCSNIVMCYLLEPSSRQLRRALCRLVRCGDTNEDVGKKSSAFKLPFQALLFSNCKGLKDHIKSHMLPEELGGTLLFDEVSYLLQIAVIDTFGKLKAAIDAMHSFIEGASTGDVLDGDVSSCLEQFSLLREQAFGLYSHLKNVGFDRFDPFPIFRKMFAEGDALHALALQIRAILMDRQHRLNAFSILCSKLGEGEKTLRALEMILTKPDAYPRLMKDPNFIDEYPSWQFEQLFTSNSGADFMMQFFSDIRYLLDLAGLINEDQLVNQMKVAFNLAEMAELVDHVESLYGTTAEYLKRIISESNEKPTLKFTQATEPLELTCTSSNSPCPLSSTSESNVHSGGSGNNKTSIATPSCLEVSPVALDQQPSDKNVAATSVSVSIQTESAESSYVPKADMVDTANSVGNAKSVQNIAYQNGISKQCHNAEAHSTSESPVSFSLTPSITLLTQLVARFEAKVAAVPKSNINRKNRPSIAEIRHLTEKLAFVAKRMQDKSQNLAEPISSE